MTFYTFPNIHHIHIFRDTYEAKVEYNLTHYIRWYFHNDTKLKYIHIHVFKKIEILGEWSEVAQLCPTLCDPMDCSLLGFSVHGIFLARVLEWVAISFSRGFSWPRDRTQVSCIAGRHFTLWATREAGTQVLRY